MCFAVCKFQWLCRSEIQAFSPNYAGRRSHIKNSFALFLEDESIADAIADIVQQVDYGNLNLLPNDIQNKGREMSDVYLYLYCIENSIRIFIAEIMNRVCRIAESPKFNSIR